MFINSLISNSPKVLAACITIMVLLVASTPAVQAELQTDSDQINHQTSVVIGGELSVDSEPIVIFSTGQSNMANADRGETFSPPENLKVWTSAFGASGNEIGFGTNAFSAWPDNVTNVPVVFAAEVAKKIHLEMFT